MLFLCWKTPNSLSNQVQIRLYNVILKIDTLGVSSFCRGFFYVTSVLYELKQSFYYNDQSTLLSSPKTIRAAVFFPQLLEVERSQLRWIRCPLDLSLGCLPEEVFSDMSCQEETSRQSPGITRSVNLSSPQSNQAGLRR